MTKTTASGFGTTAIGYGTQATGTMNTAVGSLNNVTGPVESEEIMSQMNTAVGTSNTIYAEAGSGAFGYQNTIGSAETGEVSYSYGVGASNTVSAAYSSAFGISNTIDAITVAEGTTPSATAVGYGNTVSAQYGTALGYGNTVSNTATAATVLGSQANAAGAASLALGNKAYTTANHTTAVGYEATAKDARTDEEKAADAKINTVSFGHAEGDTAADGTTYADERLSRLTNVAEGVDDYDAVNVKQMNEANIVDFDKKYAETGHNRWLSTDFDQDSKSDPVQHGENSAAYGYKANAKVKNSTALGYNAIVDNMAAEGSVALGAGSLATKVTMSDTDTTLVSVISVGNANTDLYRRITNVAAGTWDENDSNYHDGTDAVNVAQLKEHLGTAGIVDWDGKADTTAKHWLATDFENDVTTRAENSTSYGYNSSAAAENSLALGYNATVALDATGAATTGAIALGSGSQVLASDGNVLSVGSTGNERKIIHVAKGTADTDAVNVEQLNEAIIVDWDKKTDSTAQHWLSTDFGTSVTHVANTTAYGYGATANGTTSSALGYNATVDTTAAEGSVALGAGSVATLVTMSDTDSTPVSVISVGNAATGLYRRVVNVAAGVADTDAVNVKQLNDALDHAGIVDFGTDETQTTTNHWLSTDFGNDTKTTHGLNSSAYGYLANAQATNSTAFGYKAIVNATGNDGAIALGSYSLVADNTGNVLSIGGGVDADGNKVTRRITNVAAGVNETDAVNVEQLNDAIIVDWDKKTDASA